MEGLCIEANSRKDAIFAIVRFNTKAFLGSGKRFFVLKMSNSNSLHVFTPRGVFPENFFSRGWPPYCVVAPRFFLKICKK
jgi:hypothetical protein